MKRYNRIAAFVQDYPWAMMEGPLEAMLEVLELRLEGGIVSPEEIAARMAAAQRPERAPTPQPKQIAVLPVYGVLAHRMNLLTAMSGGMSTEQLAGAVRAAAEDPTISAILLDIDSPGGSVFGVQELADEIFRARQAKPIFAIANATAASAAYWIGSQATEFVMTPSGQVGSIGVIAVHVDRSKQNEEAGVKHTLISAGKHKTDGADIAPLDDDTRAHMQRRVDQYYRAFIGAVARGRGVSVGDVRDGFGEGRVLAAADALKEKMVDGVRTFDQVISSLAGGSKSIAGPAAEVPLEPQAPMPTPRKGESEGDFISRCMGDDRMVSDFPDAAQRRAVCQKQAAAAGLEPAWQAEINAMRQAVGPRESKEEEAP